MSSIVNFNVIWLWVFSRRTGYANLKQHNIGLDTESCRINYMGLIPPLGSVLKHMNPVHIFALHLIASLILFSNLCLGF